MSAVKCVFCLVICISLLSACEEPQPKVLPTVEVIAAELSSKNIPIYGRYIAQTKASLDVEVRARVSGYLEQQHFLDGSFVTKGQLLYTLDSAPYQAVLASAQAKHIKAENALKKAERDVKRLKPLFEADAASQLDLDNAYAAVDSAKADLRAAEADLQSAELDLSYTQIKAPITGVTSDSSVDIGALVGDGGTSLLANIQQVDPIFVEFQMTTLDYLQSRRRLKSYYEKVKADAEGTSIEGFVNITLPDGTPYKYPAQVKFTEPRINSDTGTFTARAEVINPERELLPGQYTRARIELDEIDNALLLPEEAVMFEQSGSYVYVVLPSNVVERRFIILGRNIDGDFLVEKGLSDGEKVVVAGTHKLQHGYSVTALSEQEHQAKQKAQNKATIKQTERAIAEAEAEAENKE